MQTLATEFTANPSLITKLLAIFALPGWRAKRRAAHQQHGLKADRSVCGGYNEAFVVQYWTGYNPRH